MSNAFRGTLAGWEFQTQVAITIYQSWFWCNCNSKNRLLIVPTIMMDNRAYMVFKHEVQPRCLYTDVSYYMPKVHSFHSLPFLFPSYNLLLHLSHIKCRNSVRIDTWVHVISCNRDNILSQEQRNRDSSENFTAEYRVQHQLSENCIF